LPAAAVLLDFVRCRQCRVYDEGGASDALVIVVGHVEEPPQGSSSQRSLPFAGRIATLFLIRPCEHTFLTAQPHAHICFRKCPLSASRETLHFETRGAGTERARHRIPHPARVPGGGGAANGYARAREHRRSSQCATL